jgi:transcriptional regulator with XRE-family HTH domain
MARGGDWLSRTLRDLRKDAGLSQTAAVEAAGLQHQVRLSRIETGRFVPSEDEVRRLCDAYHAPARVRRELLRAARDMRAEIMSSRVILRQAGQVQARLGAIEEASAEIRVWQPLLIPGLLQVEGYARAVFSDRLSGEDADRAVASRLARSAVLGSPRKFVFVISEGALRWSAGPQVMAAQLKHLAAMAAQRQIGIIPQTVTVNTFPTHGFALFDDRLVVVGLRHATAFIADPADVAEYAKWFATLEALAVFGEEARQVIQAVAGSYPALG